MNKILENIIRICLCFNIPFLLSIIVLLLRKKSSVKITNKIKLGNLENELSIDIEDSKTKKD